MFSCVIVQYNFANWQAPHQLQLFCVLMTQIRLLLACELRSYSYVQSHARRPLLFDFVARRIDHIINSINSCQA